LKIFISVLGRLKQKIIIKWTPDDSNIKLPQNIMTGSWFPQRDILGNKVSTLFSVIDLSKN